MARIRSIHPGLFTDEAFVTLSPLARVLLLGMWTEADDHGAFDWKPLTLKMRILPADNCDVDALMTEIEAAQIIMRRDLAGKGYGLIRNFCKFQRPKKPTYRVVIPQEFWAYIGLNTDGSTPHHQSTPTDSPPVEKHKRSSPEIRAQREEEGGRGRREAESKSIKAASVVVVLDESGTTTTTKDENLVEESGPATDEPLPSHWQPDPAEIEFARNQGMTEQIVNEQIVSFKAYNQGQGTRSPDWGAYWKRWCIKWKERSAPKTNAVPRIEINSSPDWDNYCRMWLRLGRWPRLGAGGEPGMLSCKCPQEVLIKHGIDPKTGFAMPRSMSSGRDIHIDVEQAPQGGQAVGGAVDPHFAGK